MFATDSVGRLVPAASASLDRNSFQQLQDDVLELQRLCEGSSVALTPHIMQWAKNSAAAIDERAHKPHHASDERSGTQAQIGFSSDSQPRFEGHECSAGMCHRPLPPLLVETLLQRYSWSSNSDALDRYSSAFILSELFLSQCVAILHSLRFSAGGGRDLFAREFLQEIDEIMRSALIRGEEKGKKAARESIAAARGEEFNEDDEFKAGGGAAGNSHVEPAQAARPPQTDRASTISHNAAAAAPSVQILAERRNRRSSNAEVINHPFAPAAYNSEYNEDGATSARVVSYGAGAAAGRAGRRTVAPGVPSGPSGGGGFLRPRQCLMSSLLALVRFTNGLGTRLKYWRNQIKAKQKEIAHLSVLLEEARGKSGGLDDSDGWSSAQQRSAQAQIVNLQSKVAALEQQLARTMAKLDEYEGSGAPRKGRYEPEFGDTTIPKRRAGNDAEDKDERINLLGSELAAVRNTLASLRAEHSKCSPVAQSLREEVESLKAELESKKEIMEAIKTRVQQREREWEEKEATWNRGGASRSSDEGGLAARVTALERELETERRERATENATRDATEKALSAAATRAKNAHASALKEYEEFRISHTRMEEQFVFDKGEFEARVRKLTTNLAEARATIEKLRKEVKRLQESAAAATVAEGNSKEEAKEKKQQEEENRREKKAKEKKAAAAAAAESLRAVEAEMEVAEAAARAEQEEAQKAAAAATERIKAAKAQRAKEKKERDAAMAAAAAAEQEKLAAAAAAVSAAADAKKEKKKKAPKPEAPANLVPSHPALPPPTAAELSKPTPKLSSGYGRCVYEEGEWYEGQRHLEKTSLVMKQRAVVSSQLWCLVVCWISSRLVGGLRAQWGRGVSMARRSSVHRRVVEGQEARYWPVLLG
jgi:peptidoglycan hydrolase CwlO-like protein